MNLKTQKETVANAVSGEAKRKNVNALVKAFVAILLLTYLVTSQIRYREVVDIVLACQPLNFFIAFGLFVVTKFQNSYRIYLISKHYLSIPFAVIVKDIIIANLFNTVLPVGSGELYRINNLAGNKTALMESAAIVTLDHVYSLFAIMSIVALSLMGTNVLGVSRQWMMVGCGASCLVVFFLIGGYLKRRDLKNRWLLKLRLFFTYCHEHTRQAFALYLFSIIIIVTLITSIFFLGLGIGLDLDLVDFLRFYPFVLIASAIPISVGGLGIRELAIIGSLGMLGISKAQCVSIGLMQYGMMLLLGVAGMILFFLSRSSR